MARNDLSRPAPGPKTRVGGEDEIEDEVKAALEGLLQTAPSRPAFVGALLSFIGQLGRAEDSPEAAILAEFYRAATTIETYDQVLHEVRSLSMVAASSLDIATDLLRADPQRERGRIASCLADATTSIEQLVQVAALVARVRAGRAVCRQVREARLVEAVELAARLLHQRGEVSPFRIERIPDVTVRAAQGELLQVLLNLLRNAREAISERISERAGLEGQGEGQIWVTGWASAVATFISVADNGPGITDEHSERLFTPFFTTKFGGTGVGLNVCRTLVEGWGGEIQYEPRPGGGAVFIFGVPRLD